MYLYTSVVLETLFTLCLTISKINKALPFLFLMNSLIFLALKNPVFPQSLTLDNVNINYFSD